jgi:hypothetical protein
MGAMGAPRASMDSTTARISLKIDRVVIILEFSNDVTGAGAV